MNKVFNYKVFLTSNSVLSIGSGLFMPFYVIFIQDFGNSVESFGFAIGLMVLAQSVTSYFVGKSSDKFGRKAFLVISTFAIGGIIFSYTLIGTLIQLYILQILLGIGEAVQMTMTTTLLGDLTEKSSRGKDVGKFRAVIGIFSAITIMASGYLVGESGINIIFYSVAIFYFISAFIFLLIKE